jgi:glyoxylase-like metal-dependent hydrolase (beta-lactamase superfamily II)
VHVFIGFTMFATDAVDIAEVQPGVLRLRLPSWRAQADGVNVWLLRDVLDTPHGPRPGWMVLDTGPDTPLVRALWQAVFAHRLLGGLPVLRVCVTRAHPDNAGLARWLCEWWSTGLGDCPLWISAGEFYAAHRAAGNLSLGVELAVQMAASHGVQDATALDEVRAFALERAQAVPQLPNRFRRLMNGRSLMLGVGNEQRTLTCMAGWGYSVEGMSLYCHQSQTLFAGDMLCPDAPTALHIGPDEPDGDAVHLLLDGLEALRDLPRGVTLYSARGERQMALATRVAEMQAHSATLLARVLAACGQDGPTTAYALARTQAADRSLVEAPHTLAQFAAASAQGLSTTIACLNALWHAKLVEREKRQGVWWFWERGRL